MILQADALLYLRMLTSLRMYLAAENTSWIKDKVKFPGERNVRSSRNVGLGVAFFLLAALNDHRTN